MVPKCEDLLLFCKHVIDLSDSDQIEGLKM